jgi:uncharacterized membrane protein
MSLLPFAQWLAETPGSIALHESLFMYPLIESVHVLTLCVFVGMSVMLDLRLLGVTLKRVPVTDITRRLLPWMFAGFVVMVITGVLLVYAIPVRSYQSIWFRMKVILLILAGLNALTFHYTVYRSVREWDLAEVVPRRARLAGMASLALWAGIIVFGRMIAYNWFDCDKPQPALVVWAAGCTTDSR